MKKPKIKVAIETQKVAGFCYQSAIVLVNTSALGPVFATKKAAREWAKEWCRTVGAALMEKGEPRSNVFAACGAEKGK